MKPRTDRRRFLALSSGLAGLAGASLVPNAWARTPGATVREYGERAPGEKSIRLFRNTSVLGYSGSRTPLQDSFGIITPSALHYESHHSGVPELDAATHELLIHGEVKEPLVLKVEDLKRLPAVTRVHFIECAGNSGGEYLNRTPFLLNPQRSHGLLSCSEWTGVLLRTLLEEAGASANAKWVLAEGADSCRMARSIPMQKAMDDVLVAYGQNGEAVRPEQGYPVRLVVPGWEGNINIKWLHRLHVAKTPFMTREEAPAYTDLLTDGKARMFSFVMEAKSVITRPAGEQTLPGPGFYEISGLAWSGRGRIERVEVSTDGGRSWGDAVLQEPRHAKAFTRFGFPWHWDGKPAQLQSRCIDDTGYVQPTRDELMAVRGPHATDHYNGIKAWQVHADGKVTHV
jgi:sulfane dehydrogenase subunit SoxC